MKYTSKKYTDFLKEMYYFEIDRKDKLNSKLTIPLSVTVLLFGIISYFLKNIFYISTDYTSVIFLFLFFIILVYAIRTVYFLIKSFFRYTYNYLPTASVIDNDIKNVIKYYKSDYFETYDNDKIIVMINTRVEEIIIENYIECIDQNILSNDLKNEYISKSVNSIIIMMIVIFITSVPYFVKVSNTNSQLFNTNVKIEKECKNVR